jgi:hypothetical protein
VIRICAGRVQRSRRTYGAVSSTRHRRHVGSKKTTVCDLRFSLAAPRSGCEAGDPHTHTHAGSGPSEVPPTRRARELASRSIARSRFDHHGVKPAGLSRAHENRRRRVEKGACGPKGAPNPLSLLFALNSTHGSRLGSTTSLPTHGSGGQIRFLLSFHTWIAPTAVNSLQINTHY